MEERTRRSRQLFCRARRSMRRDHTSGHICGCEQRRWRRTFRRMERFEGLARRSHCSRSSVTWTRSRVLSGLAPEELRRRNFLTTGDRTATGQLLTEPVDMQHLLTRALEESDYHAKLARFAEENRDRRSSAGWESRRSCTAQDLQARANADSTPWCRWSFCRMGGRRFLSPRRSSARAPTRFCARWPRRRLQIPYEQVVIAQPDTQVVPNSGPTVASRTAMIVGKLVERASTQTAGDVARLKAACR